VQRAKLSTDKTILVYCNTRSFAAQVADGLRPRNASEAMKFGRRARKLGLSPSVMIVS
jgi:Lhr-like helicase